MDTIVLNATSVKTLKPLDIPYIEINDAESMIALIVDNEYGTYTKVWELKNSSGDLETFKNKLRPYWKGLKIAGKNSSPWIDLRTARFEVFAKHYWFAY